METEYNWLYCPNCDMTLIAEAQLLGEGHERYEQVSCPECGTDMGTIRADDNYQFIGMACGYLYPGRPCCGGDL